MSWDTAPGGSDAPRRGKTGRPRGGHSGPRDGVQWRGYGVGKVSEAGPPVHRPEHTTHASQVTGPRVGAASRDREWSACLPPHRRPPQPRCH